MTAVNKSETDKWFLELRQQVAAEREACPETVRLLNDRVALQALVESFAAHDAGEAEGQSPEKIFADLV